MNRRVLVAAILFVASTQVVFAQFGSGIVFDPTQSGHAIQQIAQANQLVYHYGADDQECDRRLQPRPENGLSTAELIQLLQQPWPPGVDGIDPAC